MAVKPKKKDYGASLDESLDLGEQEASVNVVRSLRSEPRRMVNGWYYIRSEDETRLADVTREVSPFLSPASVANVLEWIFLQAKRYPEVADRLRKKASVYEGKPAYLCFLSREEVEAKNNPRPIKKTTLLVDSRVLDWVIQATGEGNTRSLTVCIYWVLDDWDWIKNKAHLRPWDQALMEA